MNTKRNFKRNKKIRKTLKGGFFSSSNKVNPYPGQCDVNQLSELKTTDEMHKNYQACCPKGMFGTKSSSPYCKQLDLNFQGALAGEKKADDEYHGFEPSESNNMKQNATPLPPVQINPRDAAATAKAPWYKFWGGKKSKRKSAHRKRKHSRRYRK
jgi:hypothetical protein